MKGQHAGLACTANGISNTQQSPSDAVKTSLKDQQQFGDCSASAAVVALKRERELKRAPPKITSKPPKEQQVRIF